MKPDIWGPPIWTFMHTIVRKMKPQMYNRIGPIIFNTLVRICGSLPCPNCTMHAMQFWRQVNIRGIRSKADLEHILYLFHNIVNERLKKPAYDESRIIEYNHKSLIDAFNAFVNVYSRRVDVRQMTDSMQRTRIINDTRAMIRNNVGMFEW